MSRTQSSMCRWYGSFCSEMYETGTPCAEKRTCGGVASKDASPSAVSACSASSCSVMSEAIAETYPGRSYHEGTTY